MLYPNNAGMDIAILLNVLDKDSSVNFLKRRFPVLYSNLLNYNESYQKMYYNAVNSVILTQQLTNPPKPSVLPLGAQIADGFVRTLGALGAGLGAIVGGVVGGIANGIAGLFTPSNMPKVLLSTALVGVAGYGVYKVVSSKKESGNGTIISETRTPNSNLTSRKITENVGAVI